MFETEAGFAETKMLINCNGDYSKKQDYKKGWQDGATFGYNKAKEEMQEQGLALQSDMNKTIEQNIQLKKQIEKMKCCDNCEHNFDVDGTRSNHCVKCKNFSNWELDKE